MPSPRRNLALLRITKFVTIRTPGLAVYFASLSTISFHMGTPYKIQKIPRTPGCNNGLPVQGISRFYLMLVLGLTRSKLRAQRCRHNGLDGVLTVPCLTEDDQSVGLKALVGNLKALGDDLAVQVILATVDFCCSLLFLID